MEDLDLLRRQYARVTAGVMGVSPFGRRQLEVEGVWAGREAAILALPQDLSAYATLQDPLTGAFPFMVGFSAVGGPDEIT